MDSESPELEVPLSETIKIVDGYILIYGGRTNSSEEDAYDWSLERIQSGAGLADYLRQVSQKTWAYPRLLKELIAEIAYWFDEEVRRQMIEDGTAPDYPPPLSTPS